MQHASLTFFQEGCVYSTGTDTRNFVLRVPSHTVLLARQKTKKFYKRGKNSKVVVDNSGLNSNIKSVVSALCLVL